MVGSKLRLKTNPANKKVVVTKPSSSSSSNKKRAIPVKASAGAAGSGKTPKYRGVTYHKACTTKPWVGQIKVGDKVKHLGYFSTEEEAAQAFEEAARQRDKDKATNAKTGAISKYNGVYRDEQSPNKWSARIWVGGKRKRLGTFATEEQAGHAYDVVAQDLHVNPKLNFPSSK